MKYLKIITLFGLSSLLLLTNIQTFAHVVVRPATVGLAAYQNFTVSVPTEKEVPTTQLRLVIPDGLLSVRPNAKPGWQISLTKTGQGEDAVVKEIIWSGGNVPVDQRDEFVFSAKTPSKTQNLVWKAYQTYQDGSVVSWDLDPKAEEQDDKGPYSQTAVVDDLKPAPVNDKQDSNNKDYDTVKYIAYSSLTLAVIAVVLSALAYQKSYSHNHK